MTAYPKLDREIVILTSDNRHTRGMINVLGRSIATYLQASEPDVVLYHCTIDGSQKAETLMMSKNQIMMIQTNEESDKDRIGRWHRLKLKMINGAVVTGDINITGYDRVSDYIQNYNEFFYELHSAVTDEGSFERLYVSRNLTIWKEPSV